MREFDRKQIKEDLREIMTKDTVFVCVGTDKVKFDIFGPLCGNYLKEKNIPYFGDCDYNVNAITMYERLEEIYDINGLQNKNIIAIDAAVTSVDENVNKVVVRKDSGIRPGAGVGRKFPMIGKKAVVMYTLNKADLNRTLVGYRNTSNGKLYDKSDMRRIKKYARELVNIIEEVYNEVQGIQLNL